MNLLIIGNGQLTDPDLVKIQSTGNSSHFDSINLEESDVITYKDKIYVPSHLCIHIMEWYHNYLCHPGITLLTETLRRVFYWPGLDKEVKQHVKLCPTCCLTKRRVKRYDKFTYKNSQLLNPWSTICTDFVGPYTVDSVNRKYTLHCVTMIYPLTRWLKIVEIPKRYS